MTAAHGAELSRGAHSRYITVSNQRRGKEAARGSQFRAREFRDRLRTRPFLETRNNKLRNDSEISFFFSRLSPSPLTHFTSRFIRVSIEYRSRVQSLLPDSLDSEVSVSMTKRKRHASSSARVRRALQPATGRIKKSLSTERYSFRLT